MQSRRRQAVVLKLRRELGRPRAKQLLARQTEQLHRIVICVDEDVTVDVEDDDRLGRILEEGTVTRFTLAQGLLVL